MNDTIPQCNNTSAGIVVTRPQDDALLLLERKKFPFGMACPAGHVEDGEAFIDAARRELMEETGLQATCLTLLYKGDHPNQCRRPGGSWHYWEIYSAVVVGEEQLNRDEAKTIAWYSPADLQRLAERTRQYQAGRIPEGDWKARPGLEPIWLQFLTMLQKLDARSF